ncbi:MAG: SDR family oxidoreductase [Reichenbachiella sp.]
MANKTAVVTGGTRGIGKAIIQKLASEGFNICTCSRSIEALNELKKNVELAHPEVNIYILKADLSKKDEVLSFVEFVKSQFLNIDVLVNNTGIFIPGEILKEEEGNLELMMNTNLYSAYHLTRGLLPIMVKQKSGHIFNMCSVASITAYPNGGSYSISKFALYGMSKVLREEMKPFGIRVTSVLPGATYTSSWEGVDVPKDRLMRVEDIAASLWGAYGLSKTSVIEDLVIRPQLGDL